MYIYRGDIARLKVDCIVCGMPMCKRCDENFMNGDNISHPYCIHVPGLHVGTGISQNHIDTLKSYYEHALKYALMKEAQTIAFCTIAVDTVPSDIVCKIAVNTVKDYKKRTNSSIQVIFCVNRNMDEILYNAYINE